MPATEDTRSPAERHQQEAREQVRRLAIAAVLILLSLIGHIGHWMDAPMLQGHDKDIGRISCAGALALDECEVLDMSAHRGRLRASIKPPKK